MGNGRRAKTEHSGAKKARGYWGPKKVAKTVSNRNRRANSKDLVQKELTLDYQTVAMKSEWNKKLSPQHKELYQRVDEVLFYQWDPIGVSTMPEARDEYATYVPAICTMLIKDKPPQEVCNYLTHTERESMGFAGGKKQHQTNSEIAELLLDHKRCVLRKSQSGNVTNNKNTRLGQALISALKDAVDFEKGRIKLKTTKVEKIDGGIYPLRKRK